MYSIKLEDSRGVISGSTVKLRNKFTKAFTNLQIQENVIRTIENLNKASVLDAFKFLMKAGASKDYLAQETHLEWAELTDEHSKIIWNEIRSQVNQIFKLFPEASIFENTCEPFVKIWEDSSFDLAIDFFKKMVKYLDSHTQNEIKRVIFLLGNDSPKNNFGGIREIGYSYEESVRFSKFSYQAFCLMSGLHMNNCYIAAVQILQYFGESDQPESVRVKETSTSDVSELPVDEPPTSESNVDFETEVQEKTLETNIKFTFDEMIGFIKNYELFKSFFVTIGGVRELGIEPQFILEHEKEFCELLDVIDLEFKKR